MMCAYLILTFSTGFIIFVELHLIYKYSFYFLIKMSQLLSKKKKIMQDNEELLAHFQLYFLEKYIYHFIIIMVLNLWDLLIIVLIRKILKLQYQKRQKQYQISFLFVWGNIYIQYILESYKAFPSSSQRKQHKI